MKFIDLFAGIGGFRLGMEAAGHECVGFCEIDKYAVKSYRAIHETEGEWYANDITRVNPWDIPDFDIICGGFPCQAFSIAGKQGGFEDTRGTLFFEIARIIQARKPKLVFLENVTGLLSHDGGRTFGVILNTLDELGYDHEWNVLNSKDFGVPQNRERVFIVGYPRGTRRRKVFPIRRTNSKALKQVTGGSQGLRVYDTDGLSCTLASGGGGAGAKTGLYLCKINKKNTDGSFKSVKDARLKDIGCEIASTLTARYYKGPSGDNNNIVLDVRPVLTPDRAEKRQNGRRMKKVGEPMFTITAQDRHGVMISEATKKDYDIAYKGDSINFSLPNSTTRRGRVGKGIANTLDTACNQATIMNGRIRRLTPKECFRLQGFPDWAFERASKVNSDS